MRGPPGGNIPPELHGRAASHDSLSGRPARTGIPGACDGRLPYALSAVVGARLIMPWSEERYPASMKHLPAWIRRKAIDIANALLEEGCTA